MATHRLTTTWPDSWGSGPLVHYSHPATLWTKEGDIKNEQTATSKMAKGVEEKLLETLSSRLSRGLVSASILAEEVGLMTNPPTFCLLTSH